MIGINIVMMDTKNRLASETSPYLLQHADNPVDWYPWGPEALRLAQESNKPILLSIGYSACHWCHVMAHESFADEETAALMNEYFINIKVDREERPDIDKIYQTAQHLLTQRSGGWPLTMFLTPEDQLPFFGGTYFPKTARHGLPAFKDLLQHINKAYLEKRSEIRAQNESLQEVLGTLYHSNQTSITLDEQVFNLAASHLLENFDARYGGFGPAPKFPHPDNIAFLLRFWHKSKITGTENKQILHAAIYTLQRMCGGGIFDHVSGGFCRYSVDDYWMIPHFEKMLYDNGPLLTLYCRAYQITQDPSFKSTVLSTAEWVMQTMQSAQGGYYSSLDADSEGVEGKYYVWTLEELKSLLTEEEYKLIEYRFDLTRGPNFEDQYHFHEHNSLAETAVELSIDIDECQARWLQARAKLAHARASRIAPGRDEKVLTSWNALMIKGMLTASRIFKKQAYFDSAQRALVFIQSTMHVEKRLFATYKDGKAHLNGYLDDYAFLLDAILEYLQTKWDNNYLTFATEIADILLDQFEDKQNGGFYFTANDHETLIERPKVSADEATPSGNGVAANSLLRLGYLLTETRYIEAAERTLDYASQQITNAPTAHGSLLNTLEETLRPPYSIILRGSEDAVLQWQQKIAENYQPHIMVFAIPDNCKNLVASIASKFANRKKPLAYVCTGSMCNAPVDNFEALHEIISK
jgi:uncharacterized protein YyaL (SSP411 family)